VFRSLVVLLYGLAMSLISINGIIAIIYLDVGYSDNPTYITEIFIFYLHLWTVGSQQMKALVWFKVRLCHGIEKYFIGSKPSNVERYSPLLDILNSNEINTMITLVDLLVAMLI
jgi:hypothetical protein